MDEAKERPAVGAVAELARLVATTRAAARARGKGKIEELAVAPAQWQAITEDASVRGALLLEALAPGDYSVERTEAFAAGIRSRIATVKAGNVQGVEADLVAQMAFLSALIAYAVGKGSVESVTPSAADVWMRLAIRAQAAYAKTAAVLVTIALRPVNDD